MNARHRARPPIGKRDQARLVRVGSGHVIGMTEVGNLASVFHCEKKGDPRECRIAGILMITCQVSQHR